MLGPHTIFLNQTILLVLLKNVITNCRLYAIWKNKINGLKHTWVIFFSGDGCVAFYGCSKEKEGKQTIENVKTTKDNHVTLACNGHWSSQNGNYTHHTEKARKKKRTHNSSNVSVSVFFPISAVTPKLIAKQE